MEFTEEQHKIIKNMAYKFQRITKNSNAVDIDDFIQEGYLAVLEADKERNLHILSHFTMTIKHHLYYFSNYFRFSYKVSHGTYKHINTIKKFIKKYEDENRKKPTQDVIKNGTKVSISAQNRVKFIDDYPSSLDEYPLDSQKPEEEEEEYFPEFESLSLLLSKCSKRLSPLQFTIIRHRFAFGEFEFLWYHDLKKKLKMSKVTIKKYEKIAINNLRVMMYQELYKMNNVGNLSG